MKPMFTAEELAELAAFDAEVDASEATEEELAEVKKRNDATLRESGKYGKGVYAKQYYEKNKEKLRAQDNGDRFVIVSHSTGKGYYRTDNLDQIMHFRNETVKRMRNTSLPLNKINRILGGCADQMKMEVSG